MSDQIIQHAGRGHSELGPSSSERWLKCTPSAVLSAQFQDKPSVYAEEGTFLHELCELKLHRYLGDMTKDVIERQYTEHKDSDFYSDEAEEVTDVYVNHCIEVIEAIRLSCADPYIAVEHRLDFSEYVPGGFGTGDFLAIGDGVIEVIDFKGGRGVRVNADHNSQLMLYGLGALLEFDPLYDIKTVRMTIVQPRLQNISSFEMDADELIRWADEYLRPRALLAQKGEGDFCAGEHCRWCKARFTCRARSEYFIENITALRATFGATAHLQWEWLRMDEDRYGIISADDSRLSDGGFRLTLGPEDVDVKVTFRCALITD